MSETPKRPWFRFHLLTLVLMMFAAGVFLWANVRDSAAPAGLNGTWRGFPFPMFSEMHPRIPFGNDSNVLLWRHDLYFNIGPIRFEYHDNGWCYGLVVINALIGVVVLAAVACVSESLIRRREGRKP